METENSKNKKLVQCKHCGEMIAKSAKTCPHCGAKNKKPTALIVVLIIAVLIIAIAAFGGSDNEPEKVGEVTQPSESVSPSAEPEKTTFGVGDQVVLNDIVVKLVDVSESSGNSIMKPDDGNTFVIFEFEIENNSEKDIAVSSMLSFEAYVDDYATTMSLSAMVSSDKTQLDGSVAAGKKMNGVIGYEVSKGWSEIEVRFTPDFWSGKDIIFVAGN